MKQLLLHTFCAVAFCLLFSLVASAQENCACDSKKAKIGKIELSQIIDGKEKIRDVAGTKKANADSPISVKVTGVEVSDVKCPEDCPRRFDVEWTYTFTPDDKTEEPSTQSGTFQCNLDESGKCVLQPIQIPTFGKSGKLTATCTVKVYCGESCCANPPSKSIEVTVFKN